MTDINKQPWASWMEEVLDFLAKNEAAHIGIAVIEKNGDYAVNCFQCGPKELFAMAGMFQSEGHWHEIRHSRDAILEIFDAEDEPDDEEDESDDCE